MNDLIQRQILAQLRLIAELLATSHPLKPECTFSNNGTEYAISYQKRDPNYRTHGEPEDLTFTGDMEWRRVGERSWQRDPPQTGQKV